MTTERRLARAGFTLTRDYPVSLERVWDAFAEQDQKLDWYGAGTRFTHVEHGLLRPVLGRRGPHVDVGGVGPNREKGSRGLLEALGNFLAKHTSRD